MAISSTLLTLNNWIEKYKEEIKQFKDEENFVTGTQEISKVTNNQIINYTGINLKIIYNKKEINCPPLEKIELDYINNADQSKISKHIQFIYNDNFKFEIPSEKLITLKHNISDDLSIISENSLSENRLIIISLYSPIIFKNKSIFTIHIKIKNYKLGNKILILNRNSVVGLPLNYINKDTFFNFKLITDELNKNDDSDESYSKNYSLETILNNKTDVNFRKPINVKNKTLTMKLDYTIRNVRTLLIIHEYSIANCLPCDLIFHISNENIVINKCTQYFIDNSFNSPFIAFSIKTELGIFTTDQINILSLDENNKDISIQFVNSKIDKNLTLLYKFKQNGEEKIIIIYPELIIYNNSGMAIDIKTKDKQNLICFKVLKNIRLISSKIDFKEESFIIEKDSYISQEISFTQLIESSPYLKLKLENYNNNYLSFNIENQFSYIKMTNNPYFQENIRSMIFSIVNSCTIINLLSTKKFVVCDYNNNSKYILEVDPFEKRGFQFFGKGEEIFLGLSVLNLNIKNFTHLIKFKFKIGVFTLTLDDFTFNLEIRKNPSNGCLDVFVIENTIDNSQIILENLSNEGISINQKKFEQYTQILYPKETQTLKLFDYYSPEFIIQTGNSLSIVNFIMEEKEKKIIEINPNIILLIEANGLKMKATFYLIEEFKKLKSSQIYNVINININEIFISIIGDNEFSNSKLINYKRSELLLFYIYNFSLVLNIELIKGVLNKNFIKSLMTIEDFKIYNQKTIFGKFSCVFKNTKAPFISLYHEINYYEKLKIAKIEKQKIKVNKIELGIDPNFINELFNFFDNILYRMNITNYNVHNIFLPKIEYDPTRILNEYKKATILINATDLAYPELNIEFELTNIGVNKLLRDRMSCSEFYIWLIKGLIGNKHKISLKDSILTFKYGGFIQYLNWFYYIYKENLENQINKIGVTGLFGQIYNIITLDFFVDDINENVTTVQTKRMRIPRVFYGKFQYMKEYKKEEEKLIKYTYIVNKEFLKNQYYPVRVILGKNEFFLFTTIALFSINTSDYNLNWDINYFSIRNLEISYKKIKVNYNQMIDSRMFFLIKCETEEIAKSVAEAINEEIENNKEYLLDV